MYRFKNREEINEKAHFWFDKTMIKGETWRRLNKAARTVFPALAMHSYRGDEAFPSEVRLAAMCGRTEKTVREGLQNLVGMNVLERTRYMTNTGRWSYRYRLPQTQKEIGRKFPFYSSVVDTGAWSKLTSSAHALYPVMRCFSVFGFEDFGADADAMDDVDTVDMRDWYKHRSYDRCVAERDILCHYADITTGSFSCAIEAMEENGLVKTLEDPELFDGPEFYTEAGWQVFLRPECAFDVDALNRGLVQRYGNSLHRRASRDWSREKLPTKNVLRMSRRMSVRMDQQADQLVHLGVGTGIND